MAAEAIKIRLGRLRIPLIKAGIKIIEKWLIVKIPFAPLQNSLTNNLDLISDVVDKLTDKDPNNVAQLKEVWAKHKEETIEDLRQNTIESINILIKDPLKAAIAIQVLEEILQEEQDEKEVAALAAV